MKWFSKRTKAHDPDAMEQAVQAVLQSLCNTVIVCSKDEKSTFQIYGIHLKRYGISVLTPGEARKANLSQLVKRDASN